MKATILFRILLINFAVQSPFFELEIQWSRISAWKKHIYIYIPIWFCLFRKRWCGELPATSGGLDRMRPRWVEGAQNCRWQDAATSVTVFVLTPTWLYSNLNNGAQISHYSSCHCGASDGRPFWSRLRPAFSMTLCKGLRSLLSLRVHSSAKQKLRACLWFG